MNRHSHGKELDSTVPARFIAFVDEHEAGGRHIIKGEKDALLPIKSFDVGAVLDEDGETPYLYTLGLHTVINGISRELFHVYFNTHGSAEFQYGLGNWDLEPEPLSHSDVATLLNKLNFLEKTGLVHPQNSAQTSID